MGLFCYNSDMNNEIKTAYFAGLIDGEGHIGFCASGKNYKHPIIQVKMTCEKTIVALHEFFKVGTMQKMKPGKPHHKPQYKWRVRYTAAIPVIAKIRPYLITKADAADLVLLAPDSKRGGKIAPL